MHLPVGTTIRNEVKQSLTTLLPQSEGVPGHMCCSLWDPKPILYQVDHSGTLRIFFLLQVWFCMNRGICKGSVRVNFIIAATIINNI